MEVSCLCDGFYGVVDFVVNGCDEALSFFEEFSFGTEVFLFEVCGFFLFIDDGLFAFFFLCFAEENAFVLIVFVERGGFVADGFDFVLPGF